MTQERRWNLYFLLLLVAAGALLLLRSNDLHGFPVKGNVVRTDHPIIAPDLMLFNTYRTSQLLYIDEVPILSRKVHYKFTGKKSPRLVLVIGLNSDLDQATLTHMLNDKVKYAQKHNYGLFCRYLQDTSPAGVPASDAMGVAKLGLMRQVFDVFPDVEWALSIDANSIITAPEFPVDSIVSPMFLEQHAQRGKSITEDQPHVKTYEHANVKEAKIILPSNKAGLLTQWFFVRNSLHGKALLEFGGDPLNQQYYDFHQDRQSPSLMLTHMVVWHPRFLAQTAIIDLAHMNRAEWQPGDFLFFGDIRQGMKLKELDFVY